MTRAERRFISALEKTEGLLLVVTGAGVSKASGIPTFRGAEPDAVWNMSDVELATREYFLADPVGQWRWYLDRFRKTDSARPNPAHTALARLESWQVGRGGRFLLVTQNIDTLHERSGSSRFIKVHGTSDRLRCTRPGCVNAAPAGSVPRETCDLDGFRASPSAERLPRCPLCGELLRMHVLFFDEYYQEHVDYRFDDAMAGAAEAELLLFAGTSFSVGITDLFLRAAQINSTPVFTIDPAGFRARGFSGATSIPTPAEEALPRIVAAVDGSRHTDREARDPASG